MCSCMDLYLFSCLLKDMISKLHLIVFSNEAVGIALNNRLR